LLWLGNWAPGSVYMPTSDASTHWVNGTQQLDGCRLHMAVSKDSVSFCPLNRWRACCLNHHTVGLEVTASCKLVKPLLQFWQQIYVSLRTQARGKGIFGLSALQGWYYCTCVCVFVGHEACVCVCVVCRHDVIYLHGVILRFVRSVCCFHAYRLIPSHT